MERIELREVDRGNYIELGELTVNPEQQQYTPTSWQIIAESQFENEVMLRGIYFVDPENDEDDFSLGDAVGLISFAIPGWKGNTHPGSTSPTFNGGFSDPNHYEDDESMSMSDHPQHPQHPPINHGQSVDEEEFLAQLESGPPVLWRIMIDQRYQGRGFGREALRQGIDIVGKVLAEQINGSNGVGDSMLPPGMARVITRLEMVQPGVPPPGYEFFQKCGFLQEGGFESGTVIMGRSF
ncbi:hypothetical protein HDU76_000176 [Blyttiomyces sp. JEL0837]|nr:hypothetical protein HDU76_000176 [Blyttiomyces sp. JEL0837]